MRWSPVLSSSVFAAVPPAEFLAVELAHQADNTGMYHAPYLSGFAVVPAAESVAQADAPVPSFSPTAVDHSAVVALQVSVSSAASLTPSDVAVVDVDHSAVVALCQFHLHLCCFSDYLSYYQSEVGDVSAASGPSATSALSLESAASVDGDPSTSPDQCSPSAPFHCAAEPSIQTVAAAHSIDAASLAVRTGPAGAALSLEAAGTGPAVAAHLWRLLVLPLLRLFQLPRLLMCNPPVFLHLSGNLCWWRMLLQPSIVRETVD